MNLFRLAASGLLVIALVVATFHVTSTERRAAPEVPCNATALAAPFTGQFHLSSMDGFGCQDAWAFTFATIGSGNHMFSVTEVLRYNTTRRRWQFASRLKDCKPTILPSVVYRQGCFSN